MCPGLYNGPFGNWRVATNPCSIHLRANAVLEKCPIQLAINIKCWRLDARLKRISIQNARNVETVRV